MKTLIFALAAIVSAFAISAPVIQTANAQSRYDDDDGRYRPRYRRDDDRYRYQEYRSTRRYRESDGCRATIRATGVGNIGGIGSKQNAIRAWRREAGSVYGREFSWDSARNQSISCKPYLAVIRCTASARPCS